MAKGERLAVIILDSSYVERCLQRVFVRLSRSRLILYSGGVKWITVIKDEPS